MTSADPGASGPATFQDTWNRLVRWTQERPFDAALGFAVLAVLTYFFGFFGYAMGGHTATLPWASQSWNEGNDLEHGPLIFPAAVVIAWLHRHELAALRKESSWAGLFPVVFGVLLFVVGVRTVQPRVALIALPILLFGCAWFIWGWAVARKIAFPCALLLFMVPVGFILNHTEPLQRLVATVVQKLCAILHLGIDRDGVTLFSETPSFHCEVAGGCSGVRSLMAMTLLSAVYVHFTQNVLWKKVLIFAFALPGAVIGNIARVFTIVLFSKFISVSIGTGPYHDISGFIVTIPIALVLMVQFGNFLNRDWHSAVQTALAPESAPPSQERSQELEPAGKTTDKNPISYDY